LADSIKDRYQHATELIEGSGGVFEVEVNGELIFSKKQEKRFPTEEEIFSRLTELA